MDPRVAVVGFVVGVLVGLTGMGGGALMTPVLILFGWAKPMMAVGTDLLWSTITKSIGSVVHCRQHTVDLQIVKRLAIGSIPGALLGLGLLAHLHRESGAAADKIVVRMLGVTLVCVALSLIVKMFCGSSTQRAVETRKFRGPIWLTALLGFVVGFLVSLTSVGSGSLIVACLVVICPTIPLKTIVGSDIVHAVLLVGVSAVGHMELGSINVLLLGSLLTGSLPGVWIGSKMSTILPEKVIRPILASTLFFLGYKLL
ncbi:MAG TPA: sulfite exporter TauE/SafE family protein [Candidatus Acidoferrales bacterium]|nr:sulfite exporter TauE/SafE family protein [Candidatus Acidoferrales bacterium]